MSSISKCPDPAVLQRFIAGMTSEDEVPEIEAHIACCGACVDVLANLRGHDPFESAIRDAARHQEFDKQHGTSKNDSSSLIAAPSSMIDLARTASVAGPLASIPVDVDVSWLSPAEADDELGRFGVFRILRLLGHGGMGVVFEAEDLTLQRKFALKVMLPKTVTDPSGIARFLCEARATAKIRHPNVVSIYQADQIGTVPFIAMELLHGESLSERLARPPATSITEIINVSAQIADGLNAAHAAGLLHRDIKPANIWLERNDGGHVRVKLLDFGLARTIDTDSGLTQSGMLVGTPQYMAPEQATGAPASIQSDLFSLGCVLYEMTTGRKPFVGGNVLDQLRSLAMDTPTSVTKLRSDTPLKLSQLIHQLLDKTPNNRPESAATVARILREGISPNLERPIQRRPPNYVIAAGVCAAVVLMIFAVTQIPNSGPQDSDSVDSEISRNDNRIATTSQPLSAGKTERPTEKQSASGVLVGQQTSSATANRSNIPMQESTERLPAPSIPPRIAVSPVAQKSPTPLATEDTRIGGQNTVQVQSPRIAVNDDDTTVVVWQQRRDQISHWNILAVSIDNTSRSTSPTELYNDYNDDQTLPSITSLPSGRFVTAWQSQNGDENGCAVRMTILSSDGAPDRISQVVNTHVALDQSAPTVAASKRGDFLIVWHSIYQVSRNHAWDVFAQMFDSHGARVGVEFLVNKTTNNNQMNPAATFLPSNDAIVVYGSEKSLAAGYEITGRTIRPKALDETAEYRVHSRAHTPFGWGKGNPRIDSWPLGEHVVVWHDFHPQSPQDGSDHGVFAQVFDQSGNRVGNEIQVNETTTGFQGEQAVTVLPTGNFFVVWSGAGVGDNQGIFGRLFSKTGMPLTKELRINNNISGKQSFPDVAAAHDGAQIRVVWSAEGGEEEKGIWLRQLLVSDLMQASNGRK